MQVESMTMGEDLENSEEEELVEDRDPLEVVSETFTDAPSVEMMRGWKANYGDIFVFNPDPEAIYIFRALRRLEHRAITQTVRQLSDTQAAEANPSIVEDHLHEKVLTVCLLHPMVDLDLLNQSEAGLVPTIFNLVMEHSKFITPERALASTFKL